MSNSETESILKKDGDCHLTKDDLKNEQETKERDAKEPKSVSFNRDVHVKRFGIPRESRSSSAEHHSPVRKEPFTHLSTEELIEEANKVRAQAESVTCTADHPPEKFYSLPHRKKPKDHEKLDRRNSDETDSKKPLGRSTSDVSRNKRTSLSTLFRKAQKKKPDIPVRVTVKPVVPVKRSKSDVSDLKSSNNINPRPIRKRSGSETEEFLKSLRNKKIQLSPIIENSPRDDYFRKTPPLEVYQRKLLENKKFEDSKTECNKTVTNTNVEVKVNPIEKPPRYKSPDKEPKPPIRTKRGKSLEKELESQPITETPKRKTGIKKKLLVDEVDSIKGKDINPVGIKDRIKEKIRKIEENIYGTKDMIHSSQKPPEKPPLTRGHTVSPIVRILKEGSQSPTPKSYLLSPSYKSNNNQPFSYTRPSISPDHNIFNRNLSPERISTPTKMDKGVVYAQVIRDQDKNGGSPFKQTIHKTYSPTRDKFTTLSDEDEGLGFEDRNKTSPTRYEYLTNDKSKKGGYTIIDSPIRPRYREYKLTSFNDYDEPTYTNGFAPKTNHSPSPKFLDTELRGRGDGMDTKRKVFEELDSKMDLEFNELSHRRKLLESRLNARKYDRPINGETVTRYMTEMDPIYEANKKMKATEKYVNETAKYYSETLEKDGFAESSLTEDFTRYDSDNNRTTNHNESRTIERIPKGEIGRRDYIAPRLRSESFPPEPEYEPPSLENTNRKPSLSPNEYTEKKYKVKTKNVASSHDMKKTKKDSWFGKRKGHYASNPEITERDHSPSTYVPKQSETYHNSLRREKHRKDKHKVTRHDSGDSQDYYRDGRSPKKYETDSRLIDSGIEPDFRKSSHNDIHKPKYAPESDDDVRDTSVFLDRERQHADESFPVERIYTNGEYITKFGSRERSVDDGAQFDPRSERLDKSPNINDKVSAKPPKATKKLSGLEKVKQLFSRDSSKKSKKEKEVQKPRTRVLKSPEHLEEPGYKRYTDPEPSDDDRRKGSRSSREDLPGYRSAEPRDSDTDRKRETENYKNPRKPKDFPIDKFRDEDFPFDKYRDNDFPVDKFRDNDFPVDKFRDKDYKVKRYQETDYKVDTFKENYKPEHQLDRYNTDNQVDRFKGRPYKVEDYKVDYKDDNYEEDKFEEDSYEDERGYKINKYTKDKYKRLYREENKVERRRYGSSDVESGQRSPRPSDSEDRMKKSRSKPAEPLDSPALAERNRERRRLATPSPSPSPTRRRAATPPATVSTAGNWFKSLDRLTSRKKKNKIQKETTPTEDELIKKSATNSKTNSPAKNLRFFGDTDIESDSNTRPGKLQSYERTHGSHPNLSRSRTSLDKTHTLGNSKHSTLRKTTSNSSSVDETDREVRNYKKTDRERNYKLRNITEGKDSENESNFGRINAKPPRNPNDRSSRSHSSSKTLKPDGRYGSKNELRHDDRGSSSELRGSKHELSADSKRHRRRTPGTNSGESSTEGESSHPSQRSVVFLHATTVGDIPDPGAMSRNRSRDDVSSVNSSNLQVKTTQKSFSLFAPWTPRHHNDPYDVNYAQKPRKVQRNSSRNNEPGSLQKKKSYSQTTLSRRPPNYNQSRLSNSTTTLNRRRDSKSKENDNFLSLSRNKNRNNQSNEVLNKDGGDRISRSISMPKDSNKKAGWFNLNKNKKQEINTRVR